EPDRLPHPCELVRRRRTERRGEGARELCADLEGRRHALCDERWVALPLSGPEHDSDRRVVGEETGIPLRLRPGVDFGFDLRATGERSQRRLLLKVGRT